jgi:hypothetical protein
MVIALVATIVSPDPTDTDPAGTILGGALVTGLVLIIWLQALLHRQAGHRRAFGWRMQSLRTRRRADPHSPGMDLQRRITAVGTSLPAALDRLTESTTTAAEDDLAKAHQVRGKAGAALRELRAQSLAVERATSAALSPDSERLAAAQHTIDQRLAHAVTDCETLVKIAGTPDAADFRQQFESTVARLHDMIGEVTTTDGDRRSSMFTRVWRALRPRHHDPVCQGVAAEDRRC